MITFPDSILLILDNHLRFHWDSYTSSSSFGGKLAPSALEADICLQLNIISRMLTPATISCLCVDTWLYYWCFWEWNFLSFKKSFQKWHVFLDTDGKTYSQSSYWQQSFEHVANTKEGKAKEMKKKCVLNDILRLNQSPWWPSLFPWLSR